MFIKKATFIACAAALCATSAVTPVALTGTASAQVATDAVRVSVLDRRGRPMRLQALPAPDRARVAGLEESARGLVRQNAALSGGIRIECTFPPLRCRIIIIVTWAH